MTDTGDRLHTIPTVCARLAQSRSTVYELFARGELRSVKVGRRRMIRESDLQAYIAALPEAARMTPTRPDMRRDQ